MRGDVVGVGRLVLGERFLSPGKLDQELPNSAELAVKSGHFLSQDRVVVAQGGNRLSLGGELLVQDCVLFV